MKRSLKTVMPILKRCRGGDSAGDDEESSVNRKKRKTSNDYFPLHLLGEAAVGIISFNGYEIQRIISKSAAEDRGGGGGGGAASESRHATPPKSKEVSRPPLVRTSRGRVQVLPSRFNDSILDNWKKESKIAVRDSALDTEYVPVKQKDNKLGLKPLRIHGDVNSNKKQNEEKTKPYKCRKFSPLSEDEIAELRNDGFGGTCNDSKKYRRSRDSLRTLLEHSEDDDDEEEYDECVEICGTDRSYSTKDFGEGDIVWAIPGKHCPAWPAIVLNQELQVPSQVFNYQIAGAVCVMFFGYSGNGTQRVNSCSFSISFFFPCNT